jgi:16S rRNA (guanine527-N7)-methyltransferase
VELSDLQVDQISTYLNLLLKWNAKMNLTAVREPESIVQRHFGESLFAAGLIAANCPEAGSLTDVGSGAGFPGLPIKIAIPRLSVTLIDSQQKKTTFLREVIRELELADTHVLNSRAEAFTESADFVTMRAVESFDETLPVVGRLAGRGGSLVLLIGAEQVNRAESLLSGFTWNSPIQMPMSQHRVILSGRRA